MTFKVTGTMYFTKEFNADDCHSFYDNIIDCIIDCQLQDGYILANRKIEYMKTQFLNTFDMNLLKIISEEQKKIRYRLQVSINVMGGFYTAITGCFVTSPNYDSIVSIYETLIKYIDYEKQLKYFDVIE